MQTRKEWQVICDMQIKLSVSKIHDQIVCDGLPCRHGGLLARVLVHAEGLGRIRNFVGEAD